MAKTIILKWLSELSYFWRTISQNWTQLDNIEDKYDDDIIPQIHTIIAMIMMLWF